MLMDMYKNILKLLAEKVEYSEGVKVFLNKPNKFENWVQVELCGILSEEGLGSTPETEINGTPVDVVFNDNCACQIKVLFRERRELWGPKGGDNTSRYLNSVKDDIEKLNDNGIREKDRSILVLFGALSDDWSEGGQHDGAGKIKWTDDQSKVYEEIINATEKNKSVWSKRISVKSSDGKRDVGLVFYWGFLK